MAMTEPTVEPFDVLGAGAGGPLSPPTAWIQGSGYLSYGGAIVIGTPPGGPKGPGTINLSDVFINGQAFDFSTVLPIAGGTMTGPLIQAADPVNPLGSATKQYADKMVPLAGGVMTGLLTLSGAPTAGGHATTKTYVDNAVAGAGAGTFVPLAGGVMTGLLTLSGAPTATGHATTKTYVDAADTARLQLAGGTMTGFLVLNANPTNVLGATPKQYVDGRTPITTDAPADNNYYSRVNNAWQINPGGIAIPDAPNDGTTYGRNSTAWTNTFDAGTF
jgi:hypothetical protein